jgi:hypothetical protein
MRQQHVATIHQQQSGLYHVTCDRCPYKVDDPMTRTEAYEVAFRHTVDAVK